MSTPLYIPSAKEVFERMLNAFSLYEFDDLMCSNNSFLNKTLLDIKTEFNEIYAQKIVMLEHLKAKPKEQILKLEKLQESSVILK